VQNKILQEQIKTMEERIKTLESERDAERERVKELELI
jgi:chaperonin cofactor prefoldin